MWSLLILVASLFVLVKASDILVNGAATIARFYGMSEFFIGTTLVALGTSLPELATSFMASFTNHKGIIVGNIIGSNITNITLILGLASVLLIMNIKQEYFEKKINLLVGTTVLFFILALDNSIGWTEGLLFLILFIWFIRKEKKTIPPPLEEKAQQLVTALFGKKKKLKDLTTEEKEILKDIDYATFRSLKKNGIDLSKIIQLKHVGHGAKLICIALFAITGIILSVKYLISSAVDIATFLNINEEIIGMTIIAFGTSIPELAVTFTSAKKNLPNILVGNLVGSNMANILLVGGISALISPLTITNYSLWSTIPFMILMSIMFRNYIRTKGLSHILEGFTMLFFYALFIFFVMFTSII